jgi:hypothetical protein
MIECTHNASTGWKNNVRQKAEIGRFREFQHSTPELGQASSVPQPPPKAHGTGQAFGGQGPPVGDMLVAGGLCRCTIQRHGASHGPGKAPRLLRVPPTGSENPASTPIGNRMWTWPPAGPLGVLSGTNWRWSEELDTPPLKDVRFICTEGR